MSDFQIFILVIVASYLLGSIPFGYLLSKYVLKVDIRELGSGNIGATNVLRTGDKRVALLTLALDMAKAIIPVLIAKIALNDHAAAAGVAAVLGHIYPVWLKFEGGKGVASSLGMFMALNFQVGATMVIVWLLVAFLFRYSSLAAICAFIAAPIVAIMIGSDSMVIPAIAITLIVLMKHRSNIKRLVRGEESKINIKKKAEVS